MLKMKFHIFECSTTISFNQLSSLLTDSHSIYSSKKIFNIKYDDYSFLATFYQEFKRTEQSKDIDGKEKLFTFDYFLHQNFSFHYINNRIFFIIYEPNKYSKYLIEYLNSIFKLKLSFKTKKIDLKNFLSKGYKLDQFKIFKARFNEISISKNSKASLEVTSSVNAIYDFENLFGNIYYDLSKIKISFFDEQVFNIELSKNGLIFLSRYNEASLKLSTKLIELLFF